MPEKKTIENAKRDKRAGKAPSTQAGEFVREEIEHVRAGKHGARSAKQVIAIGLSKARRAGVALDTPKKGTASRRTRKKAAGGVSTARGAKSAKKKSAARRPNEARARASKRALVREGRAAASPRALSRQTRAAASRRRKRGASAPRAKARAAA